uniref:(northern house mosquito) hypothetical protein n=1 Tax=Culex pipiens TaxID=7175 RepID=A0A8D8IFH1_CULPI
MHHSSLWSIISGVNIIHFFFFFLHLIQLPSVRSRSSLLLGLPLTILGRLFRRSASVLLLANNALNRSLVHRHRVRISTGSTRRRSRSRAPRISRRRFLRKQSTELFLVNKVARVQQATESSGTAGLSTGRRTNSEPLVDVRSDLLFDRVRHGVLNSAEDTTEEATATAASWRRRFRAGHHNISTSAVKLTAIASVVRRTTSTTTTTTAVIVVSSSGILGLGGLSGLSGWERGVGILVRVVATVVVTRGTVVGDGLGGVQTETGEDIIVRRRRRSRLGTVRSVTVQVGVRVWREG